MRYREPRVPCDTEVAIIVGESVRRATFVNISASGARLAGIDPLMPDALVTVVLRSTRRLARVVWSADSTAGLRWTEALSQSDLEWFRGVARGPTPAWMAPAAPRPRYREMT